MPCPGAGPVRVHDRALGRKGMPSGTSGDALPLAVRIIQVARDATFQSLLWDDDVAAEIIRRRGGGAFDPAIAARVADDFSALTTGAESAWTEALAREPQPRLVLKGDAIDDVSRPWPTSPSDRPQPRGHSSGVAALAAAAGRILGMSEEEVAAVRRRTRARHRRVAVPARIWQQSERLGPADWEQVRLHPYHSERIMSHSPFLTQLRTRGVPPRDWTDPAITGSRGSWDRSRAVACRRGHLHAKTEPRPHPRGHVTRGRGRMAPRRGGRVARTRTAWPRSSRRPGSTHRRPPGPPA